MRANRYRVMRLDKYPMNDFWNFLEIGAQGGVAIMVSCADGCWCIFSRDVRVTCGPGAVLHRAGVA